MRGERYTDVKRKERKRWLRGAVLLNESLCDNRAFTNAIDQVPYLLNPAAIFESNMGIMSQCNSHPTILVTHIKYIIHCRMLVPFINSLTLAVIATGQCSPVTRGFAPSAL